MASSLSKKEKERILKEAHKYVRILSDANKENNDNFIKNMKFAFNIAEGHWESEDITTRDADKRPHLTANKLAKFVRQVVNNEKSTPNTDEIIPVDDKGDKYVAQVYNDIISDIEYRSDIENVYGLAGEHAVAGGFGFWRINYRYEDDGFDQIIELLPCPNPTLVLVDPRGIRAFIRECMPIEEFKYEYPEGEAKDFEGEFDQTLWYEPEKVWVAEYFVKEPCKKILIEFEDPETKETGILKLNSKNELPEGMTVLRDKEIDTHKVMWYKITGTTVLDSREWMGSEIPIIEVQGHEIHLEGKTYKQALIQDAKDMNRMYDYWLTAATEQVAMSPKAPYLVTQDMIKGHEKQWEQANRKNFPFLKYNNNPLGKPTRENPMQVDVGTLTMLNIADANIKDVLGMYETSLGDQSNERSSRAITSRKAISDQGTFNFPYNFHKAKLRTKRLLIDLIPKVYDNTRVMRLRNSDREIKINYPSDKLDGTLVNDLSVGKYDIRTREQFTPSRRQQIVDNFMSAMQYVPSHADLIFNFALKYMDTEGAEKLAEQMQQRTQEIAQQQMIKNGGSNGGLESKANGL